MHLLIFTSSHLHIFSSSSHIHTAAKFCARFDSLVPGLLALDELHDKGVSTQPLYCVASWVRQLSEHYLAVYGRSDRVSEDNMTGPHNFGICLLALVAWSSNLPFSAFDKGIQWPSSHLHIFSSSHLLIFTSSHHLHTFTSSHLFIFTSSHPHIFTSSHLHIFTSAHLHIFSSSHLHIFSSSHLHIFSSSHLLIFTSSHLHICSSSHLLILTSSHPHIFTSSPLAFLPSCPLALTSSHLLLLPSCPLLLFYFSSEGGGRGSANETARNATLSHEMRFDRQKLR